MFTKMYTNALLSLQFLRHEKQLEFLVLQIFGERIKSVVIFSGGINIFTVHEFQLDSNLKISAILSVSAWRASTTLMELVAGNISIVLKRPSTALVVPAGSDAGPVVLLRLTDCCGRVQRCAFLNLPVVKRSPQLSHGYLQQSM